MALSTSQLRRPLVVGIAFILILLSFGRGGELPTAAQHHPSLGRSASMQLSIVIPSYRRARFLTMNIPRYMLHLLL